MMSWSANGRLLFFRRGQLLDKAWFVGFRNFCRGLTGDGESHADYHMMLKENALSLTNDFGLFASSIIRKSTLLHR